MHRHILGNRGLQNELSSPHLVTKFCTFFIASYLTFWYYGEPLLLLINKDAYFDYYYCLLLVIIQCFVCKRSSKIKKPTLHTDFLDIQTNMALLDKILVLDVQVIANYKCIWLFYIKVRYYTHIIFYIWLCLELRHVI